MTGLSFDLSKKNTGVAKWEGGNLAHVSEISFAGHTYFGDVLLSFHHWFNKTAFSVSPSWVAYEEIMVRNKLHGELHFGMVGVMAMACADRQVPLLGVNTMTMKKHVVGRGNCTKEEMVAAIVARYPEMEIPTHDVADAVAVGIYAQSRFA